MTRAGDLWLLGSHRLICGDATSADDVARLLGERKPLAGGLVGGVRSRAESAILFSAQSQQVQVAVSIIVLCGALYSRFTAGMQG